MTAAFTTDEDGRVRGVRYHDGRIVRLCLDHLSARAEMTVELEDLSTTSLTITGFRHYGFSALLDRPIIQSIFFWRTAELPREVVREVASALHCLSGGYDAEAQLQRRYDALREDAAAALILVTNSYIGDMAFIGEELIFTNAGSASA